MAPPLPAAADEVTRRSSGEQAAVYIRRLIFDGELEPGSRVPQDEVARALGIRPLDDHEREVVAEQLTADELLPTLRRARLAAPVIAERVVAGGTRGLREGAGIAHDTQVVGDRHVGDGIGERSD